MTTHSLQPPPPVICFNGHLILLYGYYYDYYYYDTVHEHLFRSKPCRGLNDTVASVTKAFNSNFAGFASRTASASNAY